MFLSQGSHIKTWSLEQGLERGFKLKTCCSLVTDAFEGQDVEVFTCETSLKLPYFVHFKTPVEQLPMSHHSESSRKSTLSALFTASHENAHTFFEKWRKQADFSHLD